MCIYIYINTVYRYDDIHIYDMYVCFLFDYIDLFIDEFIYLLILCIQLSNRWFIQSYNFVMPRTYLKPKDVKVLQAVLCIPNLQLQLARFLPNKIGAWPRPKCLIGLLLSMFRCLKSLKGFVVFHVFQAVNVYRMYIYNIYIYTYVYEFLH